MSDKHFQFDRIAVMGVGLIGGSIALAAKKWGAARSVVGYGRNKDRLQAAKDRGVIDEIATTPEDLRGVGLIVVCTPVDRVASDVLLALQATDGTPAVVTDAGSVKGQIIKSVQAEYSGDRFVGSHPLAGSHQTGFEFSSANLFLTRLCVITPDRWPEISDIARTVHRFWEQIGMRVRTMSFDEHDRILALTSHLPHLAASVVASIVEPELLEFAATGYRDTTRIAAGDPELWAAILALNSAEVISGIDRLVQSLQDFRQHLIAGQQADLVPLLLQGCENRRHYRDDPNRPDDGT